MTRLDDTRGSAKDAIASAESAPRGESLTHDGKLQTGPRFSPSTRLSATDGPFAETKEGLGGSILTDPRDRDAVNDVVSKIPLTWLEMIEVPRMMAIDANELGRTTDRPLFPWCSTPSSGDRYRELARHGAPVYQTACVFCGQPLAARGSVLFQGDHLVHATCWRVDPRRMHDALDVTLMVVPS
jgi:hypothetical protein